MTALIYACSHKQQELLGLLVKIFDFDYLNDENVFTIFFLL